MIGKNNDHLRLTKAGTKVETYSIKKFKVGAASVLIGASIFFGAGAAAAADQVAENTDNKTTATGDKDGDKKTEVVPSETLAKAAVQVAPKAEVKELDKTNLEKLVNDVKENLKAGIYNGKTEVSLAKLNEIMLNAEVTLQTATTQEAIDKSLNDLQQHLIKGVEDKKSEAKVETKAEEKAKEETKAEEKSEAKKDDAKAEGKSEAKTEDKQEAKNEVKEEKAVLGQLISEARVLNQHALNYTAKVRESELGKAVEKTVEVAKEEIEKALDVIKNDQATKEDVEKKSRELRAAIEGVYTGLRRAGQENVSVVLADLSNIVSPPNQQVPVKNVGSITDGEAASIERQVRIANPNLTAKDTVVVKRTNNQTTGVPAQWRNQTDNTAGTAFIIYQNGDVAKIDSGKNIIGAAAVKNVETLKKAINWFEFSSATITYTDGTVVGPATEMTTPKGVQIARPRDGENMTGRLTLHRQILKKGSKLSAITEDVTKTPVYTSDDRFLNSGVTEFTVHQYFSGNTFQNNAELYEVLAEGMTIKIPTRQEGYELVMRVKKLAPKNVPTDPNNTATRGQNAMSAVNADRFKPVKMIMTRQDVNNSYLLKAGLPIEDSTGKAALGAITTNLDGANAGVTFETSASYYGREVPVNIVATDGEESGGEVLQFETNGSNWEDLMTINITDKTVLNPGAVPGNEVVPVSDWDLNGIGKFADHGYVADEWKNLVQVRDEDGNLVFQKVPVLELNSEGVQVQKRDENGELVYENKPVMVSVAYGTKFFGPNRTVMREGKASGFGFSQGVSEFSMYMNSQGAQAGTIGFIVFDGGDAPTSYGSAQHVIGNLNLTDDQGKQYTAKQPYFGEQPGDPDFRTTDDSVDATGAWVLDDLVHSANYRPIDLQSGVTKIKNQRGVSGTYELFNNNPVIRLDNGTTVSMRQGEIITLDDPRDNFPVRGVFNSAAQTVGVGALPDEGEDQLVDRTVAVGGYKLRQATENEYVLDGIRVNLGEVSTGGYNKVAYVKGWVDFNNNGKFESTEGNDEGSDIYEVRENGTISIHFKNVPQLLDTSVDRIGVRLRISLTKNEVLEPTGIASSGEVEDFLTHVIHPPRGTKNETQDLQGRTQKVDIQTSDLFTATGKTERSQYERWNEIDSEIAPKIVVTESVVDTSKTVRTGEKHFEYNSLSATVYSGEKVKIFDKHGNPLGDAVEVTNPFNNRVEYYLSEYTEYDELGQEVGKYSLNQANKGKNKQNNSGIYRTTIDFTPNIKYVGQARGVVLRAWDLNGNSTGWDANDKTIRESLTSITLADKDKIIQNTNEEANGRRSMDSIYIPTVIDIKPVGEDETTIDVQGKNQSATPQIPAFGTVETITENAVEVVEVDKARVLIDKTKPISFDDKYVSKPGEYYTEPTVVTEPTTVVLPNGRTETFSPATKIPKGQSMTSEDRNIIISGKGGVILDNYRIERNEIVPAGATPDADHPVKERTVVVNPANNQEVTIEAGQKIPKGHILKNPIQSADNNTWNKVTFNRGDIILAKRSVESGKNPRVSNDGGISPEQLIGDGIVKFGGVEYIAGVVKDTIPQGSMKKAPEYSLLLGEASDTIPAGTQINVFGNTGTNIQINTAGNIVVTGTGGVTLNGVRYAATQTIPKGAVATGAFNGLTRDVKVIRNGAEITVAQGQELRNGDILNEDYVAHGASSAWRVTYNTGDTIPGGSQNRFGSLVSAITADQLFSPEADRNSITLNGKTYTAKKGPRELPNATHIDPTTGVVTIVPRKYVTVTDTVIEIENEGRYELIPNTRVVKNPVTGEETTLYDDAKVIFTPHEKFVGKGTGVRLKQADIDYNTVVPTDPVTLNYGTDYGYANYTPTVTPNTTATIKRTIEYVYEGNASTPADQKEPILRVNGKPVKEEQTLTYSRDYIIMDKDGATTKSIRTSVKVEVEVPENTLTTGTTVTADQRFKINNAVTVTRQVPKTVVEREEPVMEADPDRPGQQRQVMIEDPDNPGTMIPKVTRILKTTMETVDVALNAGDTLQTGDVLKGNVTYGTRVYNAGDDIPAGTNLKAGTVIIGAWAPINDANEAFTTVTSPTLPGYTAEVQTPAGEYTGADTEGNRGRTRTDNGTPVGLYTPGLTNGAVDTVNVGKYEPLISAIRADDKDDFKVYVYYKADTQVARVVYIDMDAVTATNTGVLEIHTGSTLEADKSKTDNITKDNNLTGPSNTRIPYNTAATIAKYEALGYELKIDGYTNDEDGKRVIGGRKYDEESVADSANAGEKPQNQTFYVYLGHKRETAIKKETQEVTRVIEYKYAADVPETAKQNAKAAPTESETLKFEREVTIDLAIAAGIKDYEKETKEYNDAMLLPTQAEKDAAKVAYDAAKVISDREAETAKQDKATTDALAAAEKALATAQDELAEANRRNSNITIDANSSQALRDQKAAAEKDVEDAEAKVQETQTGLNTARTNYLAAAGNGNLAKAIVTTQQDLEAANTAVETARAKYDELVRSVTATDDERTAALNDLTDKNTKARTAAQKALNARTAFNDAVELAQRDLETTIALQAKLDAINARTTTTQDAKDEAKQKYYDKIIEEAKKVAKERAEDALKPAAERKYLTATEAETIRNKAADTRTADETTKLATYDNMTAKIQAANFGTWVPLSSDTRTDAAYTEKDGIITPTGTVTSNTAADKTFDRVNSPEIAGYLPDKAFIDVTGEIDPESPDYKVTVIYSAGEQRATVNFVEVEVNDTTKVKTPGIADALVEVGLSDANFKKLTQTEVDKVIAALKDKGYELVKDGFKDPGTVEVNGQQQAISNTKFDSDKAKDQEFTVTFKAKEVTINPDDPKYKEPKEGEPIDPENPTGPKWTKDQVDQLKLTEEVVRKIHYVYNDGTAVREKDGAILPKGSTDGEEKVATQTSAKFKRTAKVNVVTGAITFTPWSEAQTLAEVTSPTINNYTPDKEKVASATVNAEDSDLKEVVIYNPTIIPINPKDPDNDPNTPQPTNPPKGTDPVPNIPNKPDGTPTTYADLELVKEVTRTITYKYADDVADTSKRGTDVTNAAGDKEETKETLTFTRTAQFNSATRDVVYGPWTPYTADTTLDGKAATPVVPGYVATGDVAHSKVDETNVNETTKDITDNVVYRDLGKIVSVIPNDLKDKDGNNVEKPADKQYGNNPTDPTKADKPKDNNGTDPYVIKYIPGTTPYGPNGQPLTPIKTGDVITGYQVPDLPTDPTQNTTITYVPNGKQIAVVHFIEVKSATDRTPVKGAGKEAESGAAESIVLSGDTGATIGADVQATLNALKAAGYTVVPNEENDPFAYSATAKYDDDSTKDQVFKAYVTVTLQDVPADKEPKKDEPIDPNNPTGPKWTEDLIKQLEDGRKATVKRTINYIYADGTPVADADLTSVANEKEKTLTFTRAAKINPVTGEITFDAWNETTQTFGDVTSPTIANYTAAYAGTPAGANVPSKQVKATDADFEETVVYSTEKTPVNPVNPNNPTQPINPDSKVPEDPQGRTYRQLGLVEEVKHTVNYKLEDGTDAGVTVTGNPQTITFTRKALIDKVTGAVTYVKQDGTTPVTDTTPLSEIWAAQPKSATSTAAQNTTIDALTTPVKEGYIASAVKSTERTDVQATDADTEETIIYRKLGKFIPVVPEGTPTNGVTVPKEIKYPDPKDTDPTKPGTYTETPTVPHVPGTTPFGPDGKPLTKVVVDGETRYQVPPVPTEDPTQNTTITYVKDGSQVAVTKFLEVVSETDLTLKNDTEEKSGVAPSVVDTGDTGAAFTKVADVEKTIAALKEKGYTVLTNVKDGEKGYPTTEADRKFDAESDATTPSQEFKVYVTIKPSTVNPNDPKNPTPNPDPTPGVTPIDPNNPTGPKWDEDLLKEIKANTKRTVTRTVDYVYADGSKVPNQPSKVETIDFTRTATINPVTKEITYGTWTVSPRTIEGNEVTDSEFKGYDFPAVDKHNAKLATDANATNVPADTVTADSKDITRTVIYTPKVIEVPVTPTNPPKPTDPVPNVPGKTYADLGLVEEVTHTVHYVFEDGTKVRADAQGNIIPKTDANAANYANEGTQDKTETVTLTFSRSANVNEATGAVTYTSEWTAKDGTTIAAKTTPTMAGYIVTAAESTKRENVKATDADTEETIIYRKLGSFKPVAPGGVNVPPKTDLTPTPYPNSDDPTKPGTPTSDKPNPQDPNGPRIPVIPHIPGTTPVGPDGKPLTPVDENNLDKGYVPKLPTDPTQDTTITYVADGSQIAVTRFVDEDGNALAENIVDAGNTGSAFNKDADVQATITKLKEKYDVVPNKNATEVNYPTADADKVFDAIADSTKDDGKISQVYTVTFRAKQNEVDPNKPKDPTTPGETPEKPKPEDKVPNDPKNRTFAELGLIETVTRTVEYVYEDGVKVRADKDGNIIPRTAENKATYSTLGTQDKTVTETLTFTRKAKINAANGDVTYLDASGEATTKELAPWSSEDSTFDAVKSPVIAKHIASTATVAEEANVKATDNDKTVTVVYRQLGQYVPVVPQGTPTNGVVVPKGIEYPEPNQPTDPTQPVSPTNPVDPTKPGTYPTDPATNKPIKPTVPHIPGTTPVGPDGKPLTKVEKPDPQEPGKTITVYEVPDVPTDPTQNTTITYVKDGSQVAITHFVEVDANGNELPAPNSVAQSIVETGDTGKELGKRQEVVDVIETLKAKGYELVSNGYPQAGTDEAKFDADANTNQEFKVTVRAATIPADPTKPTTPTTPGEQPKTPEPGDKIPDDPFNRTYEDLGLIKDVTRTIHYVKDNGEKVAEPTTEKVRFTRNAKINKVTGEVTYLDASGQPLLVNGQPATKDNASWTSPANSKFEAKSAPELEKYESTLSSNPTSKVTGDNTRALVPETPVTAESGDITEIVVYKPKAIEVPTNPQNPLNPGDKVPGDPKERTAEELGLVKVVNHTVHYVYEDGTKAADDHSDKVTFRRSAKIDAVTGAILEYGGWTADNNDTTIDSHVTPGKEGYIASAGTSTPRENLTADSRDTEETIIYRKLGSYVPQVPSGYDKPTIPNPQYPNAPKDPSKPVGPDNIDPLNPGTPTSPIPKVDGLIPIDPTTGKPLEKDPQDPNGGYKPPKPADPTKDTTIVYVKENAQKAITRFVEKDTTKPNNIGKELENPVIDSGNAGENFTKDQDVTDTIARLVARGYKVVTNGYPTDAKDKVFDDNEKDDQEYVVIVEPKEIPVNPVDPRDPDNKNPIDPKDPTKPRDPATPVTPKPEDKVPNDPQGRTYADLGLVETVTRTVKYVYENGNSVESDKAPEKSETLTFTRKAKINAVTGEVTYIKADGSETKNKDEAPWTALNDDTTFDEVPSPKVDKYVASRAKVDKEENITATSEDKVEVVVYSKVGQFVPVVPVEPGQPTPTVPTITTPEYPNDPQDPSKVVVPDPDAPNYPTDPTTVIPHVPGRTPVDPDGKPLKPIDPDNPSKGYKPPVPKDPKENTTIVYVDSAKQTVVVHFVDENGKALRTSYVQAGAVGGAITTANVDTIKAALEKEGYVIAEPTDSVYNDTDKIAFYKEANRVFDDKDDTTQTGISQVYYVVAKAPVIPVDPSKPKDPTKPETPENPLPKPGDKIPEDPKNRTYEDLNLIKEVVRTITYTYENGPNAGKEASETVTQTIRFTRTAEINKVTGEETIKSEWQKAQILAKQTSPRIDGYVADIKEVEERKVEHTQDPKQIEVAVKYKQVGRYVPKVPDGETPSTPATPTPYPNDPEDPTKVVTPNDPTKPTDPKTPIIPYVPGHTPKTPDGNPLEPVTPGKPEDGYKVPPVPENPTQDIEITYEKDSQRAIIYYVVEGTAANDVATKYLAQDGVYGKSGEAIDYTTVATLNTLAILGYEVVTDGFTTAADKNFDKDATVDQTFVVVVRPKAVPVKPEIPTDPTKPVDPNTPKPGDPIDPNTPQPTDPTDPNNPTPPKWTDELIKQLENVKNITRTITYVTVKGTTEVEVDTTNAPKVTDTVTFTRVPLVSAVDGKLLGYDTDGDGKVDVSVADGDKAWTARNNDTKFDEVKSPVVPGYVLKSGQAQPTDLVDVDGKSVKESTGLTVKSDNQDLKVVYVPVGNYVPKLPDGVTPPTPVTPTPYPNDPQDPGKVVVPEDPTKPTDPTNPTGPKTPIIPHIPGLTPKDPDGKPLVPVDPQNPAKGYIPPVPKDPSKDTEIKYEKDDQKAIVKYVVQGGAELQAYRDNLSGKSGDVIKYSTATTIATLKALGYDVVTDGFTTATEAAKKFDTVKDEDGKDPSQIFTVVVTPRIVPIDPRDPDNNPQTPNPEDPVKPKPGDPIDPNTPNPNDPNTPKWTEEQLNKLDNVKVVNRTIKYVDEKGAKVTYKKADGTTSTDDYKDKVTFTRVVKVNVVTGEVVETGAWTAVNNDTTFDAVKSPVAEGYVLRDASQTTVAATTGLTNTSNDENIEVVYVPVGKIVPNIPTDVPDKDKPKTPVTPTPYPNDPQDPGKVVTPDPTKPTDPTNPTSPRVPVIPHIPGYEPKVPGSDEPLKPVDPQDPSKGYEPPKPTDPTKDTVINYVKADQKAIIYYVVEGTPAANVATANLAKDEVTGKSGEAINYTTASQLARLAVLGYELVVDGFTTATDKNFDTDSAKHQEFVVTVKPKVVPVPIDPTTPQKPKPGQPIDPNTPNPNDPNTPKWTEDLINKLDNVRTITRTINYVDEKGNVVATKVTDSVSFSRSAKINVVTKEITYDTNWTAANGDTTFDAVKSPVVKGYILKANQETQGGLVAADGTLVAESTGLTQDSANQNLNVVYVKLGSWVPKLPDGNTPVTPYPNDPEDPTKPGTDKPVIPYVPGHTPVDPDGNPLKPVDPKDPSKGYIAPDPKDPTKDTVITYVKDPQPRPVPRPEPRPVVPTQDEEPAGPTVVKEQLPNTSANNTANNNANAAGLGLIGMIAAAVAAKRRRKDK